MSVDHRRLLPALLLSLFTVSSVFADSPVQWRVSNDASVNTLLLNGAKLVAQYDGFTVVETSGDVEVDGERMAPAHLVRLNAGVIDTSTGAAQARRAAADPSSGKRLHLVQFAGPVKPEWLDDIRKARLQIIDYIPENAYLVYGDGNAIAAMQAKMNGQTHVRWDASLRAAEKVHPAANAATAKDRTRRSAAPEYAIQLVNDPDANAETLGLIDALKLAPVSRQREVKHYVNIVAALPADALEGLAAQPDVISITPYYTRRKFDERQNQIVAGNLAGTSPSGPGYLTWLNSMGFSQEQFTASGFAVNISDSGIDDGTTAPNHFGLYVSGNTGLASRVIYNRLEGSPNGGSTLIGCDGHGTINAHIIGGYNNLSGFPHADSAGYRYGLGVSPFVKVGSSVIFDPSTFTFPDYSDLISRAYDDGARFSSDSWGADTFGGYDIDAQEYDALVRDAQPSGAAVSAAGNQEMTIVFAAGNSGPTSGSVGSPGTAKNIITVGAAENVHSHNIAAGGNDTSGNDGCSTPDSEANSADDIASFSSRGPCDDGRAKPEIVAPGTHVTGGVAQNSPPPSTSSTGDDIACFEGTGVCALPGGGSVGDPDNFFPSGQQFYTTSSGTSHSTPAVAGGASLVRQYFINQGWTVPSPAMVKAYLVSSARYMTGTSANDDLWSNNQGMGGMNLGTAFDGTVRILRDQEASDKFTGSGQSRILSGVVSDTNKPVRVTVSWTDAPGSTVGNSYNNNLDLEVTIDGNTYRGNVFSGAFSTTGGSADPRNNTESVFLPAGTEGAIVIKVTAANINSDGVPNEAPSVDQDYALVVYNVDEVEAPVISLEEATITSESCGIGNGAIDPDEEVTLDIVLRNVGTAPTTNVVAELLETNGVTAASGSQVYGALVDGGASITNSFTFTADALCGEMITVSFRITDGTNVLGTASRSFTLGTEILTGATNSSLFSITIPDSGKAIPYPSSIGVSGLGTSLSKVAVQISNWSHTYPSDVDILLVGPGGESVVLLAGVGGFADINNVNLVIDDDAANAMPIGSAISSGTYRPTDGGQLGFSSPAPSGPYGSVLSVFDGTDPNGTWSLYVMDQFTQDSGAIAGGWKLFLTTGEPFCCAINQPPILTPIGNKSVFVSNELTFAVSASDPYDSDPITLTVDPLPPGATFGVTNGNGTFTWASAEPIGVYTSVFSAADKDGTNTATVVITVREVPQVVCNPIISEYVEGSEGTTRNQAIEIFNPGPGSLDLAAGNYVLQFYFNGSVVAATTISLTGTVNETDVYVVSEDAASAPILNQADQISGSLFFGGDDAVVLRVGGPTGTVVDSLGQVGFDPGSQWGIGLINTKDRTLVRKLDITTGDTNAFDVFNPAEEWDAYAQNTFTYLGWHTNLCNESGIPLQSPPFLLSIGDQVVSASNTLTFSVLAAPTDGDTVTLTASNLPGGATFGSTNEVGTVTWTDAGPIGSYTSSFYASDNDGTVSEEIVITVLSAVEGGSESFSNLNASSATYVSGSYVGDNGIMWTYSGALTTNDAIDGRSIGFGSAPDVREVYSEDIPGGVGDISLKYKRMFPAAGTRSFEVYVDSTLVGVVSNANNELPETAVFPGVNMGGSVVIKVVGTGQRQFAVDTLTWTSFEGGDPDSDMDGLLDQWEIDNFGSITNSDGTVDSDGDFVIDLHEFLSGTEPTNDLSFLQVTDSMIGPSDGVVVTWPGVSGKSYSLTRTTNILEYIYSIIASNIAGVEPLNIYTDDAPAEGSSIYRIELE